MVEKLASNGEEASKERKGLWSPEEDERLCSRITRHGVSTWSSVAQLAGLRRSGKSCRLRWMNYLRPDLKKEPISKREEETIICLQKPLGNRWSVIAGKIPGRTDNEIKNYWNSRIRKRQQSISAGGGCTKQVDDSTAPEAFELAPPGEKEPVSLAATAPEAQLVPPRFPVFGCQLLGGRRADATAAAGTTQSTTTQENNGAGSKSEVSIGGGGSEDAPEEHCYYFGAGDGGDMDMIDLMSFGDLLMDSWDQSQLYCSADATAAAGTTQSTTTQENNGAGSESEVSVGGGGSEDAPEEHCYYYSAGDGGDMDMIDLMSFDDLLMDSWDQSQLYCSASATVAAGTTQSTTTQENNGAGSESEVSVGGSGSEDAAGGTLLLPLVEKGL